VKALALIFADSLYPERVKEAEKEVGLELPDSIDKVKEMTEEQVTQLLDEVGWSVDFITSFVFVMMCVTGMLSDMRDVKIYSQTSFTPSRKSGPERHCVPKCAAVELYRKPKPYRP
jgi:hypothetical protein